MMSPGNPKTPSASWVSVTVTLKDIVDVDVVS